MSPRRLSVCGRPGCPELTLEAYCPEHAPPPWQGSTGRDRTRTPEWRRLRRTILERDRHTCQECGRPANTVDHLVPHAAGGTDDPSNLRALCAECNAAKVPQDRAAAARARGRQAPRGGG